MDAILIKKRKYVYLVQISCYKHRLLKKFGGKDSIFLKDKKKIKNV